MKARTAPTDLGRREQFFATVTRHLPALYERVRHEIALRQDQGDLVRNELTVEDVVDAVLLRAYREFLRNPPSEDMQEWLVALAKKHLGVEAKRLRLWRAKTVHTEEHVHEASPQREISTLGDEILDFYEPDEDLKVEDVIPDLDVPTPDQEYESKELSLCVDQALERMPHEWRRALLLRHTRGMDESKLARALHRSVGEARGILEHAEALLRQHLVEAGCAFKPERS